MIANSASQLPLWIVVLPLLLAAIHAALPGRETLQRIVGAISQWLFVAAAGVAALFALFVAPAGEVLRWSGPQLQSIAGGLVLRPALALSPLQSIALLTLALAAFSIVAFLPDENKKNRRGWYISLLVSQAGIAGAFLSDSIVLFYLFFELSLIGVYFWIGLYGDRDSTAGRSALTRFFIFTLIGSLALLASIVAIVAAAGGDVALLQLDDAVALLPERWRSLVLGGFLAAFLIKLPLFPLHGWMLSAYRAAPASARAILSGALSKLGAFGLLIIAPAFAGELRDVAPLLLWLAAIGVLLGGFLALGARSFSDALIYASLSHLNLIGLGAAIAFASAPAASAATATALQLLNHGAVMAFLFVIEARSPEGIAGLFGTHRRLAVSMFAGLMAAISLPGTGSFVAELIILYESSRISLLLTAVAFVGLLLAAMSLLLHFHRRYLVAGDESRKIGGELSWLASVAVLSLVAVWLYLGVLPARTIQILEQGFLSLAGGGVGP